MASYKEVGLAEKKTRKVFLVNFCRYQMIYSIITLEALFGASIYFSCHRDFNFWMRLFLFSSALLQKTEDIALPRT